MLHTCVHNLDDVAFEQKDDNHDREHSKAARLDKKVLPRHTAGCKPRLGGGEHPHERE